MKKLPCLTLVLLLSLPVALFAQTSKQLDPLTSFGNVYHGRADGSIQPVEPSDWTLDTGSNQRGMARDPVTGHIVLVNTASGGGGSSDVRGAIYILHGLYGTNISLLDTNGMGGGNYADASAGVADDGVVYVANQTTASGLRPFIIYRWDNVWQSNTPPVQAFTNLITPSQRYGVSFDVRGAGTDTQIIIGSVTQSSGGSSGTNVVVFTTTDGTNFTAHVLGTDVTTPNFNDGIAFGIGNTFWAKRVGAPLRLMSFDLGTLTATTLLSYDNTTLPGSLNAGPLTVDVANGRLAAIEVVTGTDGPERVQLYDISDLNRGPALLDIKEFTPNNANATAPPGYLDFGSDKLYAHVINNGLMAWNLQTVTPAAPTFLLQPVATNRIVMGLGLTLNALAYPDATYQWQRFGTNLPGATNLYFTISSALPGDSGTYRVIASNGGGSTPSDNAYVTVVNLADLYHLKQLWTVSPFAGEPYMSSPGGAGGTPHQRTIAYNALSNELYIVRSLAPAQIYAIAATNVSATPPPVIKTLNMDGVSGGSIAALVAIGVADDGAIYACNADTTTAGSLWKLYRWANSDSTTVPIVVYDAAVSGDPSGQGTAFRWGDVMDVRGSGINTEIIIDNQNAVGSRYVTVLKPTDIYLTNFTRTYNLYDNSYGGLIGRSLQWGAGDTFWQDRAGPFSLTAAASALMQSSFDFVTVPVATTPLAVYTNVFADRPLGPIRLDFGREVCVGIRSNATPAAHSLALYDITELGSPLLIADYSFPESPPQGNANFIGQCIIAGDYVFALSANNGLMGFRLVAGPPSTPEFVQQPRALRLAQGSSGTLSAQVDQVATYQWQRDGTNLPGATAATYTFGNAQLTDAADYRVIATNLFGSVTSQVATVTVIPLTDLYRLSPIWSNAAGSAPYLSWTDNANTPCFRTLAYSSPANELYVVNRAEHLDENLVIAVLDPATGNLSHYLNTSGIASDNNVQISLGLVGIGVSDDGSIYACNVSRASTTASPAVWRLYRWSNSAPATPPVLVFEGEPAGSTASLRWGDALAVRGSGLDTEIIIDNQRDAVQPAAVVLTPTDASLNIFIGQSFHRGYANVRVGRSLQFGTNNTVWQKTRGDRLELSSYDLNAGTSVLLSSFLDWPSSLGGITLDFQRNLGVAVDFNGVANASPDTVKLYEIADLSQPMLIATYNFPTNKQGNANLISQCVFAGDRVFALNGNNGLVAFDLVPPAPQLSIMASGNDVLITWPASSTGFTLEASPVVSPPVWTNVGTGTVVGAAFQIVEPASATSLFYRLVK